MDERTHGRSHHCRHERSQTCVCVFFGDTYGARAGQHSGSLIPHPVACFRHASGINEGLQSLYNNTIWYIKGPLVAAAFAQHCYVPQMMRCPISGIPNVTGMTLHYDAPHQEWFVSTEGSNFMALYTTSNGLCIDRQRCFTTNRGTFCFLHNVSCGERHGDFALPGSGSGV